MIKNINSSFLLQNNANIKDYREPKNYQKWKSTKTIKSLKDDPEMLQLRELIGYPYNDKYVVLCGIWG